MNTTMKRMRLMRHIRGAALRRKLMAELEIELQVQLDREEYDQERVELFAHIADLAATAMDFEILGRDRTRVSIELKSASGYHYCTLLIGTSGIGENETQLERIDVIPWPYGNDVTYYYVTSYGIIIRQRGPGDKLNRWTETAVRFDTSDTQVSNETLRLIVSELEAMCVQIANRSNHGELVSVS
jgi:hypothetical protein